MSTNYILVDVLLSADMCRGFIIRDGRNIPCDSTAAAVLRDRDGVYYPVCTWHASRHGEAVPLAEIVAELRPSDE